MTFVVVDFAASTGGATSILKSFYNYLINSDNTDTWHFLLSDNYIEETERIHITLLPKEKKSRTRRFLFDNVYGKNIIKNLKPDAVFYLQNTFIKGVNVPQIAYMDQPIPFQKEIRFSFLNKRQRPYAFYQFIIGRYIKKACKKADLIIVQTEWMKKAICEQCNIYEEKIIKVPADVNLNYDELKTTDLWNNKVFFYPANNIMYKNHDCINSAIKILKQKDITGFIVEYTLNKNEINTEEQITFIGTIPHKDVAGKMQTETLIFPSYIESFGLPLAESRKLGGVILAADTAFSREILNDYENAYFFDPFEPSELADLMQDIISGNITKKELIHNASDKENSWAVIVENIKNMTK